MAGTEEQVLKCNPLSEWDGKTVGVGGPIPSELLKRLNSNQLTESCQEAKEVGDDKSCNR